MLTGKNCEISGPYSGVDNDTSLQGCFTMSTQKTVAIYALKGHTALIMRW